MAGKGSRRREAGEWSKRTKGWSFPHSEGSGYLEEEFSYRWTKPEGGALEKETMWVERAIIKKPTHFSWPGSLLPLLKTSMGTFLLVASQPWEVMNCIDLFVKLAIGQFSPKTSNVIFWIFFSVLLHDVPVHPKHPKSSHSSKPSSNVVQTVRCVCLSPAVPVQLEKRHDTWDLYSCLIWCGIERVLLKMREGGGDGPVGMNRTLDPTCLERSGKCQPFNPEWEGQPQMWLIRDITGKAAQSTWNYIAQGFTSAIQKTLNVSAFFLSIILYSTGLTKKIICYLISF